MLVSQKCARVLLNRSSLLSKPLSNLYLKSFATPILHKSNTTFNHVTCRWNSSKKEQLNLFPSGMATESKSPFENTIPLDRDVLIASEYEDTSCTLNDIVFYGTVLVFPTIAFMVDIRTFEDITLEKLALAFMFKPKIEYLIIGCGAFPKRFEQSFYDTVYEKYGVVVETMTTPQAMGTYNFCTEDGRNAAALFITAQPYELPSEKIIYTPRPIPDPPKNTINSVPNMKSEVKNRVVKEP